MSLRNIILLLVSLAMGAVSFSILFQNCSRVDFSSSPNSPKVRMQQLCQAGTFASCTIEHGLGMQGCTSDGMSVGPCEAVSCDSGYEIVDAQCMPTKTCQPGAHRDCSTTGMIGTETCKADGSGYDNCIYEDCKPGFSKNVNGQCISDLCTPKSKIICEEGVGRGYRTCDDTGSEFGSCVITECPSGYSLTLGLCVANKCRAIERIPCRTNEGVGERVCGGTDDKVGECHLTNCHEARVLVDGKCVEPKCKAKEMVECRENGGRGKKECNGNGIGFGRCRIESCESGFTLAGERCEREDK